MRDGTEVPIPRQPDKAHNYGRRRMPGIVCLSLLLLTSSSACAAASSTPEPAVVLPSTETPTATLTRIATTTFTPKPTEVWPTATPTKTRITILTKTPTPKPKAEKPSPVSTIEPRHNGLGPETPLSLAKSQTLNLGIRQGAWLEISKPGFKIDAKIEIQSGGSDIQTDIYAPERMGTLLAAIKSGGRDPFPPHTGAFSRSNKQENLLVYTGGSGGSNAPWIVYIQNKNPGPASLKLHFEGQVGPCAIYDKIWHEDNPPDKKTGKRDIEVSCNPDWSANNPNHTWPPPSD